MMRALALVVCLTLQELAPAARRAPRAQPALRQERRIGIGIISTGLAVFFSQVIRQWLQRHSTKYSKESDGFPGAAALR